ncbi:CaiB/BaiF CoA-transferase family protein [Conexibacter sp. CPCC 206217]|uniref:CaiB/BaiF CoA transferase family protein n=1 Tax=Conexibacter sp. CPCC 206217 TaxID=3064574 RepID=UPI00272844FE|nr:CoA transferase [Conexibacter sp. CPCC 206217]MDO8208889.1 CoA transferase [Conexibacter sp. CPCC 206217]
MSATLPPLLAGMRVLDLTHVLAGPYCTMMLADLGADVVKVERPGTGESARTRGPAAVGADGTSVPTGFLGPNRNKRSLTLDLKQPEAKQIIARLLPEFDLVVENMSAGTMDKLGLGYDVLAAANPSIVLASISGYGQPGTSPYWRQPSYGQIAEALSGFSSRTAGADSPPVFTGLGLSDIITGTYAAFGALAAVMHARATGRGSHVDVAQFDCLVSQLERLLLYLDVQGVEVPPGNERAWLPTGVLTTTDGHVMYAAISERFFHLIAGIVGRPELPTDPRLADTAQREANLPDVFLPVVREWARDKSTAEVLAMLTEAGVPVAPVRGIADVLADDNLTARGMYVQVEHEGFGPAPYIGNPVKVGGAMLPPLRSAPPLGRDTDSVLKALADASEDDLAGWRAQGVI